MILGLSLGFAMLKCGDDGLGADARGCVVDIGRVRKSAEVSELY